MKRGELYNPKKAERRYDRLGQFRIMARVEGYVVCRRKGSYPVVISEKEWQSFAEHPISEWGEIDAGLA
jgi:hypothetical protein